MARVIAAAHAASSALHAIKADFRIAGTDDLIISKGTSLEVHALDPTGLRLALEIPLNGTVQALAAFRRPSGARLLVLTTSRKFFALAYDEEEPGSVRCESSVTISELAGRLSDEGQAILVDPHDRCIIVHLYAGFVRIFPIIDQPRRTSVSSKPAKAAWPDAVDLSRNYNVRLPDPNVKHLALLPLGPEALPTLGVLYTNHQGTRAFNTRAISLEQKDLEAGPLNEVLVSDSGSNFFIPFAAPDPAAPDALTKSGVIIVGEGAAVVFPLAAPLTSPTRGSPGKGKGRARDPTKNHRITIMLPIGEYKTFCPVEDEPDAWLVGDQYGSVCVLRVQRSSGVVNEIDFRSIGQASSAQALVYLANSFIFIASHYGDSQLCRLPQTSADDMDLDDTGPPPARLEVVNTFTSLAPIVDFCVVDTEGLGQSHVVTCSGAYNDGSLRIVRHGVGLTELGVLELERVQRIWPLRRSAESEHDDLLVLTFASETRVFSFSSAEEGIEELDALDGFRLDAPTLHVCAFRHAAGTALCQVTKAGVTMAGATSSSWQADGGKQTTGAASDDGCLLVSVDGGGLHLLDATKGVSPLAHLQVANEVSCAAIHAFPSGRKVAAVCTWASHELFLLNLPDLQIIASLPLETAFLPRSVAALTFSDGVTHLFVGLGDGTLVNFVLTDAPDASMLRVESKKTVTLGQRPVSMTTFATEEGVTSLLVCSDRPTVVSRTSGRLSYASVNMRDVNAATSFNASTFPSSLVLATPDALRIGRIDDIKKLHIRTITFGAEQPQRIVYNASAKAYGVLCLRETLDRMNGVVTRKASFKILDDASFGVLADFDLDSSEQGLSLISAPLGSATAAESFIVGTGVVLPDTIDSKSGRIIAYSHDGEGSFTQAGEQEVDGAAFALAPLIDGRLAAAVNSKVIAFDWRPMRSPFSTGGFEALSESSAFFLATTLASRLETSQLLVGDALRSCALLQFDAKAQQLTEVARDHSAFGIAACASLDADMLIAAETELNLYSLQVGTEVNAHGGESIALMPMGMFHLGEFVNKFVKGSTVPTFAQSTSAAKPNLLYATSSGTIGVVADVDLETATLLTNLQRNMRKLLPALGGLDHEDWRTFRSANATHPPVGFIDGGFVERFATLPTELADKVLQGVSEHERITEDRAAVYRLVEDLERIH